MWYENIVNSMSNRTPTEDKNSTFEKVEASLQRRYRRERRFRRMGVAAIAFGVCAILLLFSTIISKGYTAFWQTYITLPIELDAYTLGIEDPNDPEQLGRADYRGAVKQALRDQFPEVKKRHDKIALYKLMSGGAGYLLRDYVLANPGLIGSTVHIPLPSGDEIDMLMKEHIDRTLPESERRLKDRTIAWVDQLVSKGMVEQKFSTLFFTSGDSRDPEMAGILGAAKGSLYTMLVTLLLSFPIGVAAAIYLEEFAPKNRWSDIIEVNINNLAAVPSIVFGLLGLAVYINFFGLPRSAPLVGGLVLTLMTLPTIIISSRAALKSVPPSIREAALGMGASKMQMVFHHVLPLALPGMLTGTIIGMAQALGESAPLLMIGMVAFIVDIPSSMFDPATVLPVQIYLWADSPERAFVEKTSAAIMVLLMFLLLMNFLAVLLRRRFERRW